VTERGRFVSGTRVVAGVVTVVLIFVWILFQGLTPFSPGGLNAQAKGLTLGGVRTHAQLSRNCAACHAAPWSSRTMDDRCLVCHSDVRTQINQNNGVHGGLVRAMSGPTCRVCHSEHRGPRGELTANFNHNAFPFKLTGAHVNVPCQLCHTPARSANGLQNTPTDCYACHAKMDKHHGTFGTDCGACHSTTSWANATFNHTIFPINHGTNQQASTCTTCHPKSNFSTYTCYGCHFHTPARVRADHEGQSLASLTDCIRCHAGGRTAGGG
jgi:Cytochrome c3